MNNKRSIVIILLALLLVLVTSVATVGASGGSLTIGLSTEPVSLDPGQGLYIAEQWLLMNIYDTLVRADQQNNLYPGLATSWEVSDDTMTFTFTLRDDVTFHDGTPFNAEAVKAYFDRVVAANDAAATATSILAGYQEATVDSDTQLTVSFDTPKPTFLVDLSRVWMGIPSPTAVEASGEDFARNPVGTGPFVFSEWVAQDHITLTANADYTWGAEFAANASAPLLDTVTFRFLPEGATRLTALQTGEVQVVEDPPALAVKPLLDAGTYVLQSFPAPGMPSHMMINTAKAPTDDILVRQAMIYSVNQEELTQVAFAGLQSPAYDVLSPSTFGYSEAAANLYRYDPDKAAALLDQAGWVDSNGDGIREKDGEPLKIVYPAIPAYEEAFMELLSAYLTDAGFSVDLTTMDDAGIFEFAAAGNQNIVNMGWTSRDPGVLNYVYNSANIDGGSAFTRFVDTKLDDDLNKAAVEVDDAQRAALYEDAQMIIMENALAIPLYNYDRVMALDPSVQGWTFDSEGYPLLYEVSLAE